MPDQFITIWNQLVLLTQFPVYTGAGIEECFDKLEKQTREAYAEGDKSLSTLQMLSLMNSIQVWRDILAEQSAETDGEESSQSDRQEHFPAG